MNTRNKYNALINWPDFAKKLGIEAEKIGAYECGIVSDKRNRGTAINVDLYGYDEKQGLIVVQVRQAIFHPRKFTEVKKNYLLIGTNEETGNVFTHGIESPARSKVAMSSPENCISYVLAKIWDCREKDLIDIIRQGDIAFVPVPNIPKNAIKIEGPVILRDTHKLTGEIYQDGITYYTTRKARLKHIKGQHATVKAKGGFYRVQTGNRANLWSFSLQKGD